MSYNVRGKYAQQAKYSNRGFNQMLDLIKVKSADTVLIEDLIQRRIDKAANAGDIGPFGTIMKGITSLTPGKIDDLLWGTAEAAWLDKRRSDAIGGIDTSGVQYLGDAAKNADMEVLRLSKDLTKGLKFGDKLKDVGWDVAWDVVQDSEGFKNFKDEMKVKWGELTEDFKFGEGKFIDFVKEGTEGFLSEFKEYAEDPVEYSKAVKKYKNPLLYDTERDDKLFELAMMSMLKGGGDSPAWLQDYFTQMGWFQNTNEDVEITE